MTGWFADTESLGVQCDSEDDGTSRNNGFYLIIR